MSLQGTSKDAKGAEDADELMLASPTCVYRRYIQTMPVVLTGRNAGKPFLKPLNHFLMSSTTYSRSSRRVPATAFLSSSESIITIGPGAVVTPRNYDRTDEGTHFLMYAGVTSS